MYRTWSLDGGVIIKRMTVSSFLPFFAVRGYGVWYVWYGTYNT